MRNNKYIYLYVIQGFYGYGWEDVDQSESHEEIRNNYKAYKANEPQYMHRIIERREPNINYREG